MPTKKAELPNDQNGKTATPFLWGFVLRKFLRQSCVVHSSFPSVSVERNNMPKLLLLIPTLDHSGAEKQFALLATRLPQDEFDVHAVTLTRGGPYEAMIRDAGVRLTASQQADEVRPARLVAVAVSRRKQSGPIFCTRGSSRPTRTRGSSPAKTRGPRCSSRSGASIRGRAPGNCGSTGGKSAARRGSSATRRAWPSSIA